MKKRKFWSFALLILLVLSIVLAACGNEDGDRGKEEDTG